MGDSDTLGGFALLLSEKFREFFFTNTAVLNAHAAEVCFLPAELKAECTLTGVYRLDKKVVG